MTDTEQPTGETTSTLEEANEAGFFGQKVDPEPNESYTVGGVVAEAQSKAKTESKPKTSTNPSGTTSTGS